MPPVAQDGRLAFHAAVWPALQLRTVTLARNGTGAWADLLERARHGALSAADIAALRTRELPCPSATAARLGELAPLGVTTLYFHNEMADRVNAHQLHALPGPPGVTVFDARDFSRSDHNGCDAFFQHAPPAAHLRLRLAAQVVLLAPLGDRTPGARAVVTRLEHGAGREPRVWVRFYLGGEEVEIPRVEWRQESGDVTLAWRRQVPLALSWALPLHRAQSWGLRFTTPLLINFRGGRSIFDYGQAYAALALAPSLDALNLEAFEPLTVRAHPDALAYHHGRAVGQDDHGADG